MKTQYDMPQEVSDRIKDIYKVVGQKALGYFSYVRVIMPILI